MKRRVLEKEREATNCNKVGEWRVAPQAGGGAPILGRDGNGQRRLPKTKYRIWGLKNVWVFAFCGGQVEAKKQENKEQTAELVL